MGRVFVFLFIVKMIIIIIIICGRRNTGAPKTQLQPHVGIKTIPTVFPINNRNHTVHEIRYTASYLLIAVVRQHLLRVSKMHRKGDTTQPAFFGYELSAAAKAHARRGTNSGAKVSCHFLAFYIATCASYIGSTRLCMMGAQ